MYCCDACTKAPNNKEVTRMVSREKGQVPAEDCVCFKLCISVCVGDLRAGCSQNEERERKRGRE